MLSIDVHSELNSTYAEATIYFPCATIFTGPGKVKLTNVNLTVEVYLVT